MGNHGEDTVISEAVKKHLVRKMVGMIKNGETFEDAVSTNDNLGWDDWEEEGWVLNLSTDSNTLADVQVSNIKVVGEDSLRALWEEAEKQHHYLTSVEYVDVELRVHTLLRVPKGTLSGDIKEAIGPVVLTDLPDGWSQDDTDLLEVEVAE